MLKRINGRDAQKGNARHVTKLKILGIIIGIVIVMTTEHGRGGFCSCSEKTARAVRQQELGWNAKTKQQSSPRAEEGQLTPFGKSSGDQTVTPVRA